MKDFTTENLNEVLTKMFETVGAVYTPEFVKMENWYWKHSWTKEQRDSFRKWLVQYIKKGKFVLNSRIEKEVDFFLFNYGWVDKEK